MPSNNIKVTVDTDDVENILEVTRSLIVEGGIPRGDAVAYAGKQFALALKVEPVLPSAPAAVAASIPHG